MQCGKDACCVSGIRRAGAGLLAAKFFPSVHEGRQEARRCDSMR